MRKKTETRRSTILGHALDIFRKEGFERASMSQIAAQVGGSKATLYNYFSSKEELLLEAMLESGKKHCDSILALLSDDNHFPDQLLRFVCSLLRILNSAETVEILRVAISVGGNSDVGRQFYERGTQTVWPVIAERLKQEIGKGHLRAEDPDVMAMHLRWLCEADLVKNLLGAAPAMLDDEIEAKARSITAMFLGFYGAMAARQPLPS